jgi:choline dehydrogenase-like flavoprotein
MSKESVIIIGSGAGGSVAAWALNKLGHDVMVFEKGRNLLPGLGTHKGLGSLFGNDEIKAGRVFENQDELLEPRTGRTQAEAAQGVDRSFVGDINDLPTTVGGGTVHWDAKTPRFWKHDFKALSMNGPVPDANVADWPFAYDDLAPYYDEVEKKLAVQGDLAQIPKATLDQAPRDKPFPQPPNPPMYAGKLLAQGAASLGYSAYPFPQAVHSQPHAGHPGCNSCGFCSGFGCPINARGGAALSFLHGAMQHGVKLKPRSFVYRIDTTKDGKRATGVSYLDENGKHRRESADIVIVAASAIESARLMLMSASSAHPHGLGNRSGQLGRNLMFHFFSLGVGFFGEDVHAWRGPSTTFTIDDFIGPETGAPAKAAGLPYLKGGICEVGGSLTLLPEAQLYAAAPGGWGKPHKNLMRQSPFRAHITGMSMVGEDMPQEANVVDLDPKIKDVYGFPVPRITRSPHKFEQAASAYYGPKLQAICQAAPGCVSSAYLPVGIVGDLGGDVGSIAAGEAATAHIMGTARMGTDPAKSVCDPYSRVHEIDNLFVGDGAVFATAAGMNPTLTIMAVSLRMARQIGGAEVKAKPRRHKKRSAPRRKRASGRRDPRFTG